MHLLSRCICLEAPAGSACAAGSEAYLWGLSTLRGARRQAGLPGGQPARGAVSGDRLSRSYRSPAFTTISAARMAPEWKS